MRTRTAIKAATAQYLDDEGRICASYAEQVWSNACILQEKFMYLFEQTFVYLADSPEYDHTAILNFGAWLTESVAARQKKLNHWYERIETEGIANNRENVAESFLAELNPIHIVGLMSYMSEKIAACRRPLYSRQAVAK